jgi:hypothetical protein
METHHYIWQTGNATITMQLSYLLIHEWCEIKFIGIVTSNRTPYFQRFFFTIFPHLLLKLSISFFDVTLFSTVYIKT